MFNLGKTDQRKKTTKSTPIQASPTQPARSVESPVYEVEEVFVPRGIPDITLVDRSGHPKLSEVRMHLKSGGLISLHGDSKSGKTVLCLKILERRQPILLHGPHIQTEDDYWRILGNKLKVPAIGIANEALSTEEGGENDAEVVVGGGPSPGSFKKGRSNNFAKRHDKGYIDTYNFGSHEVVEKLRSDRRPVVIDDFHAVPKEVQHGIIVRMKPAIDHGVTLIVVSIPEETGDIVSGLSRPGEAVARSAKVEAPLWDPEEIRQIPKKGFAALNMRVSDSAIETLTRRAYRNPLLMQDFCLRLCFDLGIERTLPAPTDFRVTDRDIDRVVRAIAAQYEPGYRAYLGGSEDTSGKWRLATGHEVNIYVLILLALSRIAINNPVRVSRIRERIVDILSNDMRAPNEGVITSALLKMTERMNLDDQEAPLRFDATRHFAYVAHPFFKMFLVFSLVPKYS